MHIDFAAEIAEPARTHVGSLLRGWDSGLFTECIMVRPLPGGANNQNYVVTAGDRRYALRIANQDNDRMAVDRDSARRAQSDAARIGIAPKVLAHSGSQGHLLSEFVDGHALSADTIGEAEVLAAIAGTFGRLHAAQSDCRAFDPFADIDMWIADARQAGVTIPDVVTELQHRARAVRDAVDALGLPKVFCHNDTVPQNFMWDTHRIILVDWDYAGHYYPSFELGSFICTADLTAEQRALFLHAYDARLDAAALARIELMQFVAALREIAWVLNATGMLQGTTMVADAFYDDYLTNNLHRARQFGLGPRFHDLLGTASRRGTRPSV
jgi:thiamine kinase-like enzyme